MKRHFLPSNRSTHSYGGDIRSNIKMHSFLLCILFSTSQNLSAAASDVDAENKISIDTSTITLSGLSAGGYMANQFHMSHPELVSGIGIIAAGPYGCARNSIMIALSECVNKVPDKYPANITNISEQFSDVSNSLIDDKVWLLHGTLDTRITAKVSHTLHKQYMQIIDPKNLVYINDKPFPHLFPTLDTGVKCDVSATPFIGDCGYDAAGEMLQHIIGNLQPRVSKEQAQQLGQLVKIEQAELTNLSDTGMHKYAFAFIPRSCKDNSIGSSCRLHISFHGCNQSIDNIGDQYAQNTGINEWAANNHIVVLYPQVAKSTLLPMNPQACWDWWGYTDENYSNKNGKQIQAVHAMALSIAGYVNM